MNTPQRNRQYNIKDHLGNVRLAFAGGTDEKKYLYNGNHEKYVSLPAKQTGMKSSMISIDDLFAKDKTLMCLSLSGPVHLGIPLWRPILSERSGDPFWDDPQLGRWHSVDPKDEYHSPYVFVGKNPITFIEPDGRGTEVRDAWVNTMVGGLFQEQKHQF